MHAELKYEVGVLIVLPVNFFVFLHAVFVNKIILVEVVEVQFLPTDQLENLLKKGERLLDNHLSEVTPLESRLFPVVNAQIRLFAGGLQVDKSLVVINKLVVFLMLLLGQECLINIQLAHFKREMQLLVTHDFTYLPCVNNVLDVRNFHVGADRNVVILFEVFEGFIL